MSDDVLAERIVRDPDVAFGKPTIRGTRIWVASVLGMFAEGASIANVLDEYRQLSEDDVRACLAYGARLAGRGLTDVI